MAKRKTQQETEEMGLERWEKRLKQGGRNLRISSLNAHEKNRENFVELLNCNHRLDFSFLLLRVQNFGNLSKEENKRITKIFSMVDGFYGEDFRWAISIVKNEFLRTERKEKLKKIMGL